MNIIQTDLAPAAIGPYSQAIESNGFVFCSGQIGLNPETGELVKGFDEQVHQIMRNIQAVLEAAELTLDRVVKTTVFLTDMNDFPVFNDIYEQFFHEHRPARSTVAVKALPKGAKIEIEVIAVK
ncbi:MAG: RidA family protein [Patescibacteria group bacterium]|nr:RidA family protein [Patescibacteria group bacterium]